MAHRNLAEAKQDDEQAAGRPSSHRVSHAERPARSPSRLARTAHIGLNRPLPMLAKPGVISRNKFACVICGHLMH